MALTLTYTSVPQFIPTTVHTAAVHNEPHDKLISNDNQIAAYVNALEATVASIEATVTAQASTLVRITPVLIYRLAYTGALWFIASPILSYKEYPAAENWAFVSTYVTHSYPAAIPVTAKSIFLNIGIISASQKSGFMNLRSLAPSTLFPEDTVCESISRANNDDSAADNVTIEMPYEPTRLFQSYCGVSSYAWFSIAAVGYRT